MKRIIKGLRYDTEKGVPVGSYETLGLMPTDPRHWEATLYKSPRSGRFFLAGEGGPMTRFAARAEGFISRGADLFPLSREEALSWAEHFLTVEVIEKHFSDLIQDA